MEEIKKLQRENFDMVMRNGKDLILFVYKNNDPASILGIQSFEEVNGLIGRSFELYLIDSESEPDVIRALSVESIPEYISIKECKIYKKSNGYLKPGEILALLK